MKLAHFAAVTALGLAAAAASAAPARACGPVTAEDWQDMAVERHFAALNAHDREALLAAWAPGGTVLSRQVGGYVPVRVETVDQAADRWLAVRAPIQFEVVALEPHGAELAVARVRVTQNGQQHQEELVLRGTARKPWAWKIVADVSLVVYS